MGEAYLGLLPFCCDLRLTLSYQDWAGKQPWAAHLAQPKEGGRLLQFRGLQSFAPQLRCPQWVPTLRRPRGCGVCSAPSASSAGPVLNFNGRAGVSSATPPTAAHSGRPAIGPVPVLPRIPSSRRALWAGQEIGRGARRAGELRGLRSGPPCSPRVSYLPSRCLGPCPLSGHLPLVPRD